MKYAVVTGASSGMGLEFARQLAERKYGIVIVSNQPEENRRVAEMLRRQNHVDVRVIDMDLTLPKAAEDIYQQVTSWELEVEVLVSNAGMLLFLPWNGLRLNDWTGLLLCIARHLSN